MERFHENRHSPYDEDATIHTDPQRRLETERLLLIEELADQIKTAFFKATQLYLQQSSLISKNIKQYISRKDLDVPLLETHTDLSSIRHRLKELGYATSAEFTEPDESLIVIHLPPTMRHLPYFSATPEQPKNTRQLSAEMYARAIPAVWNKARKFCGDHGLAIHRINPNGEHKNTQDGFYYLWMIVPAPTLIEEE